MRKRADKLVSEYEDILLHSPFIFLEPFGVRVARKAAEIRATYNIQSADAIQLASAMNSASELFITNDGRLSIVKEIKIIQLSNV